MTWKFFYIELNIYFIDDNGCVTSYNIELL